LMALSMKNVNTKAHAAETTIDANW